MGDPYRVRETWRALGRVLAERRGAAGLSQKAFGAQVRYSRSSIGNIETGLQHVDRSFWEKADKLLAAGGALVRGYESAEDLQRDCRRLRALPSTRSAVLRSNAIGLQSVEPAAEESALPSPAARVASLSIERPRASSIGWADVEYVREMTRMFALSENAYGGELSADVAAAQLRHSAQLVEVRASNEVRQAMLEAVGNLSGVVGFSAFDAIDYRSAQICFDFELWCAEEARSRALRASALADMARLAIYLGNEDKALSLIEFAQVRSDRLPGTTAAMLSAIRARLLALRGRHAEALGEVDRSDELFSDRQPGDDVPWMSYYDEAEHQGSTGRALVPIARATGDLSAVVPRMRKAIQLHDDQHPRSRTFSRVRLSALMVELGDPEEGAAVGRIALDEASQFRSRRLHAELKTLASIAGSRRGDSDVTELSRDITESMKRIEAGRN